MANPELARTAAATAPRVRPPPKHPLTSWQRCFPGESADAWHDFLADLKDRGLPSPLLVISDGAPGVSSPVGYRWFRHAGGVNPCLPPTVSGRYLSFSEREDIALFRAQSHGVREIARRVRRVAVDDLA